MTDYSQWVLYAHGAGMTQEEIQLQVRVWEHEAAERAAGRCPRCGAALCQRVDPRQVGPTDAAGEQVLSGGTFVSYWCSRDEPPGVYREENACGYRVDVYEK